MGNRDVAGLVAGVTARRIRDLVDAVLVIVGREEYDVVDVVMGYKLQKSVPFGAIAADEGLAAVGADGRIAGIVAEGLHRAAGHAGQRTPDGPNLIDRIGQRDKLPGRAVLLG